MKLEPKLLLAGLCLNVMLCAHAADETVMYKKVDENGNVTFTDKPIPGSTLIKVETDVNIVDTPKTNFQIKAQKDEEQPFQYDVLAIDQPQNDQGVRANDGTINVVVGLTPQLKIEHSLVLKLDGQQYGQRQKVPYFALSGVERGTHDLQVVVMNDDTDEEVQTSQAIKFHALKTSILNNNRRRNPRKNKR